jgi:hypothetical protein
MSGSPVRERAPCSDRYGDWEMTPSAENACAAIPGTTNAHWGQMITGAQMRAARALLKSVTSVVNSGPRRAMWRAPSEDQGG